MRALSVDLRKRVVEAWRSGEGTQKEVASRFGVGVASVKRWARRQRLTGSLSPGASPGAESKLSDGDRLVLVEVVQAAADLTREEIAQGPAQRVRLGLVGHRRRASANRTDPLDYPRSALDVDSSSAIHDLGGRRRAPPNFRIQPITPPHGGSE